jgi:hypothetical protein
MPGRGWINGDSVAGIAALGISTLGWYRIRTVPFQSLEAGLGPAFFPAVILAISSILAASLTIRGIHLGFRTGGNGHAIRPGTVPMKMAGLFIGFAIVFRFAGLIPAGVSFLFSALLLLKVKVFHAAAVTATAAVGFYVIFGLLFRMRLF